MKADETDAAEWATRFLEYCRRHPTDRFWQALRNWSGNNFVFVSDRQEGPYMDTFHWKSAAKPTVANEQRTPEQEAALQELVDQAQELNMGYDQNAAIDKAVDETLEQYPKTMAYLANEQSPPKSWLEAKKEIDEGWER